MESALTIKPPVWRASSSAKADLPLAVGPAIRTAFLTSPTLSPAADCAMSIIATLISHPAARILTPQVAHMASDAVGARGIDWLSDHIACDLMLPEPADPATVRAALRDCLALVPVDIVVQNGAARAKKILIADMDSTMIDQECIDELADEVGLKDHIAAITARSMNGEIAFEPALRERVALLKGLETAVVEK